MKDDSVYQIGSATYIVERIFSGNKTPKELVTDVIAANNNKPDNNCFRHTS